MKLSYEWARVHGGNEHESGREACRQGGARDRDGPVLNRLPEHSQDISWKLRELVEEQHAVMREANLAGAGHAGASTARAPSRDGVGGRAEGRFMNQAAAASKKAGNTVDFRGLD